ncbi:hypothetical protein [Litchfieldia alkalitelluris]|uniref:hypothetical protein n=1 Tax=Litchfieldia alkalitelluris TaxID=304268 RepID=UPI000998B4AD|nr:hypothetical protein [Litchfieldia alkalitelluris]
MLVEINLLPKKQIRNRAIFLIILFIFILAIISATVVLSKHNEATSEKLRLASQLTALETERVTIEQSISQGQETNNVIKLERTVKWAEDYFVETVPLLKHLSGLLPERGFIQSFTYTQDGNVSYIVQFDSSTEVAHYLASLNESNYLVNSTVNSIMANELSVEDVGTITEEEIVDPITGEKTLMTTYVPPTPEADEEVVMPRYLAQFQLQLNNEQLKLLQKEGE